MATIRGYFEQIINSGLKTSDYHSFVPDLIRGEFLVRECSGKNTAKKTNTGTSVCFGLLSGGRKVGIKRTETIIVF